MNKYLGDKMKELVTEFPNNAIIQATCFEIEKNPKIYQASTARTKFVQFVEVTSCNPPNQ